MPISRILVLDYHASLRSPLFPKTKRTSSNVSSLLLSLSLFLSLLLYFVFGRGNGLADRIEFVDI